jgi:hypothetical protein
MEELVKVIVEKTNLPEAQARMAAQAAVDFLKSKLPASVSGYVDTALNSGYVDDIASQATNILGNIFKKDK